MPKNLAIFQEKAAKITTFLFDIDGVFTDGSLILMPNNELLRRMSTRDGYAVQYATLTGYRIGIISGGSLPALTQRFTNLGVPYENVFLGIRNKKEVFDNFLLTHQLQKEEVFFMGDDLPDYSVMRASGLSACPANAVAEIQEISDYISPLKGGEGCVRDIIEKILTIQNKWGIEEHIRSM